MEDSLAPRNFRRIFGQKQNSVAGQKYAGKIRGGLASTNTSYSRLLGDSLGIDRDHSLEPILIQLLKTFKNEKKLKLLQM